MTNHSLKLPPHLRAAAAATPEPVTEPEAADQTAIEEPVSRPIPLADMVSVTTPLGTVTCPPGRLKLNLLEGGMPPLPGRQVD